MSTSFPPIAAARLAPGPVPQAKPPSPWTLMDRRRTAVAPALPQVHRPIGEP
jgi:hypothetical protein